MNSEIAFTFEATSTSFFGGAFTPEPLAVDDNQYIFVQLRPGLQQVRKCLSVLKRVTAEHPDVPYSLAGVYNDTHACMLTLAIDLGARTKIASVDKKEEVDAAAEGFRLISAIYSRMFDFLPQYMTAPDAQARAAARALVSTLVDETAPSVASRIAG